MKAKINIDKKWANVGYEAFDKGLLTMATDIHAKSSELAPKDTRNLVEYGVISETDNGYKVSYDNEEVPYAKRRHYENYKNPQTLKYLEMAGDSVAKEDITKYIKI